MTSLRHVLDWKSPWFIGGGVVSSVVFFALIPFFFPGEAYHYDVKASWTEDKTGTLLVSGSLIINRPCPGSTVTSVYQTADKLALPTPAVRVGHIEPAMVGKATVVMGAARAATVPVATTFAPPPEAIAIRWLLAPSRDTCPEDAKRDPFEIGYVRIPPK